MYYIQLMITGFLVSLCFVTVAFIHSPLLYVIFGILLSGWFRYQETEDKADETIRRTNFLDFLSSSEKYLKEKLDENEIILYTTKIHWIVYLPGLLIYSLHPFITQPELNKCFIYSGILVFLFSYFYHDCTQFAITDKHLVSAYELSENEVKKISLPQVSKINVWQDPLGKLLNYGHLSVSSTQGSDLKVLFIREPHKIKEQLQSKHL